MCDHCCVASLIVRFPANGPLRSFLRFISVSKNHLPCLEDPKLWHTDSYQVPNLPKNFHFVLAGNCPIQEPGCVGHSKGQQEVVLGCLNQDWRLSWFQEGQS